LRVLMAAATAAGIVAVAVGTAVASAAIAWLIAAIERVQPRAE